MGSITEHLRLGARGLARDRGFTVTAALTLALGIGLATSVFTVAEALLLRKLPVRDQDRLVVLWGEAPDRAVAYPLGYRDARAHAADTRALAGAAFFAYHGAWPTPVRDGQNISRLRRAMVSGEFFDVLGARPALGRTLRPDDDRVGAKPVTVLSYNAWQRLFGGATDAIGEEIVVHGNGVAHEIVGVMPQGLDLPQGTDFWVPLVPATTNPATDSTIANVHVVGRLAAGVALSGAREELSGFFRRPDASPWARNLLGVVTPLERMLLGDTKPAVVTFAIACIVLLLITCVNVANLLLVRGLARHREFAVRSALGASRGRLIAQLLTENVILALAGGALGLLVASVAVRGFVALAPASVPRLDEIQLNATALGGTIAITGLALIVFGLAPAIITSRVQLQQALRGTRGAATPASRRATETLVVGQIALAMLVLCAAALIARTFVKLQSADLALEPSRVLIGELAFRYDQADTEEKQLALLDRILPAVRAVPGVRSVSPVVAIPFSGPGGWDGRPGTAGQTVEEASRNPLLNMEVVVPSYFATLGIAVQRGRRFTDEDRQGAPPVVVVSESAARSFWPNEDPLGKRVFMGGQLEHQFTVVGVVRDTRYRDLRNARPSIYFPLRQSIFPFAPLNLAVRTADAPAASVPALRRAISEAAPGIGLANAAPFETYLDRPLAQPRLNAVLLTVFASTALALAAIGLFGVMTTMVRQRTREVGVRLALGATPRSVRQMVMRRGLALAITGTVLGIAASLGLSRFLTTMLYGIEPTDVGTLAGVTGVLLAAAAVATALPARRSARVDPVVALRTEV